MHLESDVLSGLFLTIRESSISSHPNLEVELFEFIFSSYTRDEIDFQFKYDVNIYYIYITLYIIGVLMLWYNTFLYISHSVIKIRFDYALF